MFYKTCGLTLKSKSMGRTSKLAYRFDMILVAIFLMGILVILLYIADKYEYGGGIALIIGGFVIIGIGSYYFRDCIRIDTKINKVNGKVTTKTENIGYWETETTLEKKYEDAFANNQVIKEIQSLAFEVAAEAVYIVNSNYNTKKIKHVQDKIPNLWKKIIDREVLNKGDMKDLKKAIYAYQEELGRALAFGEWNESLFNQWIPESISKHPKPEQPSLSAKASNVKSEAEKL